MAYTTIMKSVLAISVLLALSGCAACRQHPAVCAAAVTIVAAGVAISVADHNHGHSVYAPKPRDGIKCGPEGITCQP